MPDVTLKGNPVKLSGGEVKVGDSAPDFKLQLNDLSDYALENSSGKTRIIASVPSLDTPVCHDEAKRFSDEVAKLSDVEMICVSADLPFGQARWCGAENVSNIVTGSDHRDVSFGKAYGVLIDGGPLDRCLARAIFVVGSDNVVKHVEYVGEITEHPNYDAALSAASS